MTTTANHPAVAGWTLRRFTRIVARVLAFAWLAFWLWFTIASSVSEGPPPWLTALSLGAMLLAPPILMLLRPRIGGLAFLLVGIVAALYFQNAAAFLLLALPAALIGVLLLIVA